MRPFEARVVGGESLEKSLIENVDTDDGGRTGFYGLREVACGENSLRRNAWVSRFAQEKALVKQRFFFALTRRMEHASCRVEG